MGPTRHIIFIKATSMCRALMMMKACKWMRIHTSLLMPILKWTVLMAKKKRRQKSRHST